MTSLIRYPQRNCAVDFLRGCSILLVVFTHFNITSLERYDAIGRVYLFHMPALLLLKAPLHAVTAQLGWTLPRDVTFVVVVSLLVVLGGVLHTWFSEPALRFLRNPRPPANSVRLAPPAAS